MPAIAPEHERHLLARPIGAGICYRDASAGSQRRSVGTSLYARWSLSRVETTSSPYADSSLSRVETTSSPYADSSLSRVVTTSSPYADSSLSRVVTTSSRLNESTSDSCPLYRVSSSRNEAVSGWVELANRPSALLAQLMSAAALPTPAT